ncbi:uncharacterized protein SOCE836_009310 [Sorangium cellulosum]|uniref:Uncharacterized protein n=1 Tax=Sorangium cellulosum TaxID=56 RepID=A0A4P2QGZ7_SORCE|nr:uncharacterized protein SOCE836_009310 [Sorangium cellulosum]WCQ88243.1 hypothetical protein NQZ70_00918 [Sorangium sp. Soce836]
MRRKSSRDDLPPSRRRPSLSGLGEWERKWVRKMGLDDIPWDPEQCCEHCLAARAARGDAVEEIAPPSESRPKPLLIVGEPKTAAGAGGPKRPSKRRGKLRLVRSPRVERKDA